MSGINNSNSKIFTWNQNWRNVSTTESEDKLDTVGLHNMEIKKKQKSVENPGHLVNFIGENLFEQTVI